MNNYSFYGVYSRTPNDSINNSVLNYQDPNYCAGNATEAIRIDNFKFLDPQNLNWNVSLIVSYVRLDTCPTDSNTPKSNLVFSTLAFSAICPKTGKALGQLVANSLFDDKGSGTLPGKVTTRYDVASKSGVFQCIKYLMVSFNKLDRQAYFFK